MRIGAILSVKDEVELIEQAILHLRAIGVDRIIACDMGSTDGTYELMARYRSDGDFWLTRLSDQLQDNFETWSRVVIALARSARVDWVLYLDADEFWLPASGTMKLCQGLAEVDLWTVPRFNVPAGADGALFPVHATPDRYRDIPLIVEPPAQAAPTGPEMPWIMDQPEDKVLVRPEMMEAVSWGGHDIIPPAPLRLRRTVARDVLIAHLPFTTKARFSRKIDNIRKIFATHDKAFGAAMAFHWRRWLDLQDQGLLETEVDASLFTPASLTRLRAEGRLSDAASMLARLRADAGGD
jgi:glycosyltransferase involved in cell wall biosynthesis